MKKNKTQIIILILLVLVLIVGIILIISINSHSNSTLPFPPEAQVSGQFNASNLNPDEINSDTLAVNTSNISVTYTVLDTNSNSSPTGAISINLSDNNSTASGNGVTISGNTITITTGGTFYITGSLSNGTLIVDAKDKDVRLILAGVNIHSEETAAIYGKAAKNLVLTLAENTTNIIEDSVNNSTASSSEEQNAAIYSKADLIINGTGNLTVKANYEDGIVSKDTLKLVDGNITINAVDDGIRGKDFTAIKSGNYTINAGGDGIKSNNDTDSSLGYIIIEDGNINIISENDGIYAKTVLNISGGTFDITTGGGNSNANKITTEDFGKGFQKNTANSTSTDSAKGIKACSEINISNGTFNINSADDSIHSNGIFTMTNGNLTLTAGDDGIHADNQIKITDGKINITTSYEGIEASYIEIDGGEINLTSTDDGINIAGGTNGSQEAYKSFTQNSSSDRKLIINGGSIYVNANGDGLDSNGSIYINGGYTIVNGPTNNGNGSLDYDIACVITDGTLIVTGSMGMMQTPSTNSTQYTISITTSGIANQTITLKDSTENEILNFTPVKTYQSIVISSPKLKQGETYTLSAENDVISTITVDNIVSGVIGSGMGGGGMHGEFNKGGMKDKKFKPDITQ